MKSWSFGVIVYLCIIIVSSANSSSAFDHRNLIFSPGVKIEWDIGEREVNYCIESSTVYAFDRLPFLMVGGIIGINLNDLFDSFDKRFTAYCEIETGLPVLGISVGKYFFGRDELYFRGFTGAYLYLSYAFLPDDNCSFSGSLKYPVNLSTMLKKYAPPN